MQGGWFGFNLPASKFVIETIETIRRNFYVDDCLKSTLDTQKAIRLIEQLRDLLIRRSFRLTKFVSNDVTVLASVPESERAESVVNLDFDELPVERALGVQWNVQEDVFSFRIVSRKKAAILSDVSSMYDPLGFVSPFILPAKRLLQHLCKAKVGWDEEISTNMLSIWERWLADLPLLQRISVPRCYISHQFSEVKNTQLHHFSDASTEGYGAVSYLRFADVNDKIHCSLVMGKSRVAPTKPTTIPRLELTGATLAVKQHCQIRELDLQIDETVFWTFMRRKREILSPSTLLLSITLPGIVFKKELGGLSVSLIIFVEVAYRLTQALSVAVTSLGPV